MIATVRSLDNAMFGPMEMDYVISELFYKGTILQRNYRKMTNFMVIFLCKIPWLKYLNATT